MGRTRAAVLDGAGRAIEKHGSRRATMADIANLAGVAKGTLYNHFRTKDAVYAAALDTGLRSLAEECAPSPVRIWPTLSRLRPSGCRHQHRCAASPPTSPPCSPP